jgi:HAD superfamily hydrolase (TIGR01509 family)
MPPKAVIFDVEGTLIDCVADILTSWMVTLAEAGHAVARDELQGYSGMDGGDMLDHLLPNIGKPEKKRLLHAQGERYRREFIHGARPFEGARNLLGNLTKRGVRLGIATTCKADELKSYDKELGALDLVEAVACGDDALKGKPHPDLFLNALHKLSLKDAAQVLAVGDTPYDMLGAKAAGLRTVGVLTGGFARAKLFAAGCEAVVDRITDVERFC